MSDPPCTMRSMKQRIFTHAVALADRTNVPLHSSRNWRYFRSEADAVAFAESVEFIADTIWVHNGYQWVIAPVQPSYTYGN
jgi:uncharacterized protein YqcC (DUF446 family)